MVEKMPAQQKIFCDCCKRQCGPGFERYIQCGKLTINCHGLDNYGDPVCDGTVAMDLCDACLNTIRLAINIAVKAVRK